MIKNIEVFAVIKSFNLTKNEKLKIAKDLIIDVAIDTDNEELDKLANELKNCGILI